jgi:hypothetical protein
MLVTGYPPAPGRRPARHQHPQHVLTALAHVAQAENTWSRATKPSVNSAVGQRGKEIAPLVLRVDERLHLLQRKFAILVGVHCLEN